MVQVASTAQNAAKGAAKQAEKQAPQAAKKVLLARALLACPRLARLSSPDAIERIRCLEDTLRLPQPHS